MKDETFIRANSIKCEKEDLERKYKFYSEKRPLFIYVGENPYRADGVILSAELTAYAMEKRLFDEVRETIAKKIKDLEEEFASL